MQKICLIKYDMTEKSGGERVASILSRELCDYFEVHLVSICGKDEQPYYKLDSRVKYSALLKGHERIRKTVLSGGKAIRRYVKENKIDTVLSIGGNVNSFMWSATYCRKIKKIFCEHINLKMALNDKMNAILRKIGVKIADKIVTLTNRDRLEYLKYYKLDDEKVVCIYNWVDDALKAVNPKYNKNSNRIITVGRFEEQKGYDMLVTSAREVFARHSDWHWDIYGDGEEFDKIKALVVKYKLDENVHLKGTSRSIYDKYPEYAFYVMTSRMEGLPMVLLEAKANGLPIVSFDCLTGPSEIVRDGVDGILVEPNDTDRLCEKICELIEKPELRAEFSAHSKENIELFDKQTIVKKWVDLIKNLK